MVAKLGSLASFIYICHFMTVKLFFNMLVQNVILGLPYRGQPVVSSILKFFSVHISLNCHFVPPGWSHYFNIKKFLVLTKC